LLDLDSITSFDCGFEVRLGMSSSPSASKLGGFLSLLDIAIADCKLPFSGVFSRVGFILDQSISVS
jgi:hypothetical protein